MNEPNVIPFPASPRVAENRLLDHLRAHPRQTAAQLMADLGLSVPELGRLIRTLLDRRAIRSARERVRGGLERYSVRVDRIRPEAVLAVVTPIGRPGLVSPPPNPSGG